MNMYTSTTSYKPERPMTLEEMASLFREIKKKYAHPVMARMVIIGCRKHIKALQKEFEYRDSAQPFYDEITSVGVQFYIQPYLKKLRLLKLPRAHGMIPLWRRGGGSHG